MSEIEWVDELPERRAPAHEPHHVARQHPESA